jgi:hypothetical protein
VVNTIYHFFNFCYNIHRIVEEVLDVNTYLILIAILFIILLLVVFTKGKLNKANSIIFKYLIILNLVGELLVIFSGKINQIIIFKLLLLYQIIWLISYLIYIANDSA